jgi:hypothetical protein
MLAHVLASNIPDCQQHALAFVVTRTIGVGLAKIAQGDGAINSRDDV